MAKANKSPKLTPTRTDFTTKAAAAQLSSPLCFISKHGYFMDGIYQGLIALGYCKRDALIFAKSKGQCEYCGIDLIKTRLAFDCVQFDHIHPKSKGGSDDADNLAFCCQICNVAKSIYVPKGNSREEKIADASAYISGKRNHANEFWAKVEKLYR